MLRWLSFILINLKILLLSIIIIFLSTYSFLVIWRSQGSSPCLSQIIIIKIILKDIEIIKKAALKDKSFDSHFLLVLAQRWASYHFEKAGMEDDIHSWVLWLSIQSCVLAPLLWLGGGSCSPAVLHSVMYKCSDPAGCSYGSPFLSLISTFNSWAARHKR